MKRRILFLIPSLAGGGAERTLINLLKIIDYNQYEITLVSVTNKGQYLLDVPSQVNYISLFNNPFIVRILEYLQKRIGFDLLFHWKISCKVKGSYHSGISFLDGNITDLIFFINRIEKRYAWVHSAYLSNFNFYKFYKNTQYKEKLIRKRYGKLDGIFFVSNDAMDEFIKIFGQFPNMKVIYNLINKIEVIERANEPINEPPKTKFTFIAVGSLAKIKGFDRLIRASKILLDKGVDLKLQIIGIGPEEENLNELITKFKLNDQVELKGYKTNPYPYIKNADVLVMSSISEALPTVLCEAMILGKPTLVSNCSGCREIVDNGEYGLIAELDDSEYALKMERYINDRDLIKIYSEKSLIRSKLFDDEKILEQYYKVFQN